MEEITVKPTHIAIIMDGNGRWATRRGMERPEGHKAGAESVRATLDCCCKYGIKYLTLYAFSTENWKRSSTEVGALMKLLSDFLDTYGKDLVERKIRLRVIGDIDRLPWPLSGKLKAQIKATEQFTEYNLTIALSYGSRAEIAGAARKIAESVLAGKLSPNDITEETVAANLQTADIPDPDLIIRTAGEQRLSNFLLYQSAYAEWEFPETLWPDFGKEQLLDAIFEYSKRDRRFGKV